MDLRLLSRLPDSISPFTRRTDYAPPLGPACVFQATLVVPTTSADRKIVLEPRRMDGFGRGLLRVLIVFSGFLWCSIH